MESKKLRTREVFSDSFTTNTIGIASLILKKSINERRQTKVGHPKT